MKKRISALFLALALIFSVSAAAATPRVKNPIIVAPKVTASSTGVTCSVKITSDSSGLTASGTVTLYKNGSYLTSWSVTSTSFKETYTPGGKGTYRMDYEITVKGPAGTDYLSDSEETTY